MLARAAEIFTESPALAPIAMPISWISRFLAGAASAFGWSKPMMDTHQTVVVQRPNFYSATSTGSDVAMPLALIHDNATSVDARASPYGVDEMSFAFLKKRSALCFTIPWTTSQGSGTSLLSELITPSNLCVSGHIHSGSHNISLKQGPPINYLANLFTYWRGGVELTVKIPKTVFHSGRIQVTFTPTVASSITSPNIVSAQLALREIIDLRETNEFTLRLPYSLGYNYLPTTNIGTGNFYSGLLDIIVLNELRAPETASSSVDLLLYFNGADDFELEAPSTNQAQGTLRPYAPQAGGQEPAINETIGGVELHPDMHASSTSIGEMFTSVKQLLSRYTPMFVSSGLLGTTSQTLSVYPWAFGVYTNDPTTGDMLNPPVFDVKSSIADMYAFHKGSVSLGVITGNTNTPVMVFNDLARTLDPTVSPRFVETSTYLNPAILQSLNVSQNVYSGEGFSSTSWQQNVAFAKSPYYCATMFSKVIPGVGPTNNIPLQPSQPVGMLTFRTLSGVFNYEQDLLVRSMGDDYQLSYFVGCPPYFVSTT